MKKILYVDVKTQSTRDHMFEGADAVGGRLLALRLFQQYQEKDPIVFAPGSLRNQRLKTLIGKTCIAGTSPASGTISTSSSGGVFGQALVREGYDAMVLVGNTTSTQFNLETQSFENQKGTHALRPGPAGVHGCKYGTLTDFKGIHGRGGFGCALAKRGVRAITYDAPPRPILPDAHRNLWKRFQKDVVEEQGILKPGTFRPFQDQFVASVYRRIAIARNFNLLTLNDPLFDQIRQGIDTRYKGERAYLLEHKPRDCPVRFPGFVHVTVDGEKWVKGPLNQSAMVLGPNLGIGNIQQIYNLAYLCDEVGVDTLSFGALMSAQMNCGMLEFGDYNTVRDILHALGQGTAKRIHKEGAKYFDATVGEGHYMHAKGVGLSAFRVEEHPFLALLFAVSSRGPDHFRGGGLQGMSGSTVAEAVYNHQQNGLICDALGIDRFSGITASVDYINELAALHDLDPKELTHLADETLSLERKLFLEGGGTKEEDTLPAPILRRMQDISIDEFLSRKEETPVLQDARKFPNVKEYFLHNVAQWQQEVNK